MSDCLSYSTTAKITLYENCRWASGSTYRGPEPRPRTIKRPSFSERHRGKNRVRWNTDLRFLRRTSEIVAPNQYSTTPTWYTDKIRVRVNPASVLPFSRISRAMEIGPCERAKVRDTEAKFEMIVDSHQ